MPKKMTWAVILVNLIIPFFVAVWDIRFGVILFFLGSIVSYRVLSLNRLDNVPAEQAKAELLNQERGNRSRTIYV